MITINNDKNEQSKQLVMAKININKHSVMLILF